MYKLLILSLFGGGNKDGMDHVCILSRQRGDFKDKKEGDPFTFGAPSLILRREE